MNNETKWDVFKIAMKYAAKSGWLDYDDMINRYDDALPDDLPVIPEELGECIKWGKKYDIQLYVMYYYQLIHRPGFKKLNDDAISWMIANQDTFARTWVLGAWHVEETGEIVKLEEEK